LGAPTVGTNTLRITNDFNWTNSSLLTDKIFLASVHPSVKNTPTGNEISIINDDQVRIVTPNNSVKLPINIYYKF